MSLLNNNGPSQQDDDESDQRHGGAASNGAFFRNGSSNQLHKSASVISSNGNSSHNGNGLNNNNHEEYKMNLVKRNVAEEDPLTGPQQPQRWSVSSDRPQWAHKFASTNFFMVIFLLAYVLQGCYFTYFASVITTLEKIFHIKSASIAFLLNFSEIGQICTALLLTYFAGRGHRPRWIACGMLLFSIAAFMSVTPHFLVGSRFYKSSSASINQTHETQLLMNPCNPLLPNATQQPCNEDNSNSSMQTLVLVIFSMSLLGIGIGQTAIATLGIPYIDDNVKSKQSPLYMAITIGVRILGPAMGFFLGSFCVTVFVDLSHTDIDPADPQFIGAWWLGLFLVATSMFFGSLVMFTFPKNLRNKTSQVLPAPTNSEKHTKTETCYQKPDDNVESKLKDFLVTIKRQLKNDILMCRTASAVLHLLPITGLYIFLPKYLETQFHIAPQDANLVSGIFGILVMGLGIFITGVISVKFSLSAKKVAAWIAFTALATSLGMLTLSFIGCPTVKFSGVTNNNKDSFLSFTSSKIFEPTCPSCNCKDNSFAPVCGANSITYFSPCHAGCTKASNSTGKINYSDCSCSSSDSLAPLTAVDGFCESNRCDTSMYLFVAFFALTVFIHSTSEVGGMLIIMRCTHPKDKAMAMGIIQFSLSLLSNIPCPHIFARIIDRACIVWAKMCGDDDGYCTMYDADSFRRFFFGVSSFIMFLAFIMDIYVYLKSHRIDIDPEANVIADAVNSTQEIDQGAENLLNLRKMSVDGGGMASESDEPHRIAIKDEN